MSRPTSSEVAAEAVAMERVGLARFAVEHKRQVIELVAVGRISAAEADLLNERIAAFVGQILTGLHVAGDSPLTRQAVRRALAAENLLPGTPG